MKAAQDGGFQDDQGSGQNHATEADILDTLLDRGTTFAEQNAKRLRQVRQAFTNADFPTTVDAVDILIRPLELPINKCFRRSAVLRALKFKEFGTQPGTTQQDLESYSKETFLTWANGDLGRSVVKEFMASLHSQELADICNNPGSLVTAAALPKTCFQLIVFGMTDIWRRLVFAVDAFPWKMFSLVDCSVPDFISKCHGFLDRLRSCPHCLDAAFSIPLLEQAADLSGLSDEDAADRVHDLQRLLLDLVTYCPLATDLVENVHGQQQTMFSKFRGRTPAPTTASMASLLHSLKVEHSVLNAVVCEATLPSRNTCAQTMKSVGRRKSTYEVRNPVQRVRRAATRKLRRINGWNLFLREQLQKRVVPQVEYKAVVNQCGRQWRSMSQDCKDSYTLRAKYEQGCREELSRRPLAHGQHKRETLRPGVQPGSTTELENIAGATVLPCKVFLTLCYVTCFPMLSTQGSGCDNVESPDVTLSHEESASSRRFRHRGSLQTWMFHGVTVSGAISALASQILEEP